MDAHEDETNVSRNDTPKTRLESGQINLPDDGEKETRRMGFDVYKGRLPLAYRKPSDEKAEELRNLNIEEAISELEHDFSNNIEKIRDVIRAVVIQNREDTGAAIYNLMRKYVELVPYAVDMMLSTDNLIEKTKTEIASLFGQWLTDGLQKPDYVVSSLVRLVLHISTDGKNTVARYLEKLPRDGSSIVGREIFLSLLPETERSDLLRFRKFYWRATQPERRALIRGFIANKTVHDREKEPWLKAVRSVNQDPFIESMIARKIQRR